MGAVVIVGGALGYYLGARGGGRAANAAGRRPAPTSTVPPTTVAPTTTAALAGSGASGTAQAGGGVFGSIAAKLQAGEAKAFDATYSVTTTSGNQTVQYAASPPSSFFFRSTEPGGAVNEVIGTPAATYTCQQLRASASWDCLNTGAASSTYAAYTETYTGEYWYKQMESLEAAATVAGVKYGTSTMQLAGQSLDCISYLPSAGGGGEVCVTATGVLGYVHDNAGGATFRLTSYSQTVDPSLFQLPAGALSSGTG